MSINHFGPFNADVWGTVSDWASIIINGVAALLIYNTLRSQLAIQKMQEKTTEIEDAGFIKTIEPKFTFDIIVGEPILESRYRSYLSFNVQTSVTLNQNPSKNVKLTCTFPFQDSATGNPATTESIVENEFMNYGENFVMGLNVRLGNFFSIESYVFMVKYHLLYSDMKGNNYSQEMTARVANDGVTKKIGNPILLK